MNRKKLIEAALPLEAINTASAREKSIRHGHPSTLHLWWARRRRSAQVFQSRSTAFGAVDRCRHTLEYLGESKADTNADTAHIVTARF